MSLGDRFMHTPASPPETPLPGKRGFLKGLLGLGAAATVIPIRAEAAGPQSRSVSARLQAASFCSNETAACAGLVDGRSTYSRLAARPGSTWRR